MACNGRAKCRRAKNSAVSVPTQNRPVCAQTNMVDPRTIIGALVTAKACHVTSAAECHRRYDAKAKEKWVVGIVVSASTRVPEGARRASTFITAAYTFGGGVVKQKTLNARSVKFFDGTGDNDGIPEPPPPPVPDGVLVARDLNIPAAAGVVGRSSDDGGGQNDSLDDDTVEPERDARDVYGDLGSNDPFAHVAPAANAPPPPAHDPNTAVATAHGVDWYKDDFATRNDMISPVVAREWHCKTLVGNVWRDGCDPTRQVSRLDIFLQMFPPVQLSLIVTLTNEQLRAQRQRETTSSEVLKYIGIMVLATRCQFSNRRDLWNTVPSSPYEIAYNFGRTGMTRHRFDILHCNMRYSRQLEDRPLGMSSECYRWMLVDDFVTNFNNHRAAQFYPSHLICVDESMSRWYGQGGEWINHGLPFYVAIDRKPENGCEI
jgi:Transposase IS4